MTPAQPAQPSLSVCWQTRACRGLIPPAIPTHLKLSFGIWALPRAVLGWLVLSLATAAAFSTPVFAQGNDMGAPTGARATLMGNTGVALGRDGSAPFNNPATIISIRDQRLAFSVNFYSLGLTRYGDWHRPGTVDTGQFGEQRSKGTSLVDTAFRSLPSTLCLFFTLESLASSLSLGSDHSEAESNDNEQPGRKLAICFATLETEDIDQQAVHFRADTDVGLTTHVQSLQRRWVRTYIGPTYSVSIDKHWSVGASVHAVYTYDSFGIDSDSLSARVGGGGVSSRLTTSGSGKSFELTGVLGVTYRFDRVTLGASFRPPSLHVLGDYSATSSQATSGDPMSSVITDAAGSLRSAPPTRIALGAGMAWDRLVLEFDTAVGIPLQNTLTTEVSATTSTFDGTTVAQSYERQKFVLPSQFTVNPSAGFEYLMSPRLSLLGGISSNFSSLAPLHPRDSVGNVVQSRMHHIAVSLGLGSYWQSGELLFGFQFDYGWGTSITANPYVIPNQWAVIDAQSYTLLLTIAGSTNLSAIVRMVSAIANGGDDGRGDGDAKDKTDVKPK